MAQFFHGLHTPQTCHNVWDALDRRVQQHVPVPANIQQLRTAIKEEWDNIPQSTINSLINSMQRSILFLSTAWVKWWSHSMLAGFLIHAPTFLLRYLWPTDAYLYSQSCEIYWLGPHFKSFQWTDFLIWTVSQKHLWKCCMLRLYFCSVYIINQYRKEIDTT